MFGKKPYFLPACLVLSSLLAMPPAVLADPVTELDFRYRVEFVDQDGVDKEALASTARLQLGLRSAEWQGFDAGVMFHGNRVIGERRYNDTVAPEPRPVVADPADTGISQAWVRYRQGDELEARLGRQRLIDDNARFLGNVGFRQLEQTFDALHVNWRPSDDWDLSLTHLDRAHRIFGTNHPNRLMAEAELDSWLAVVNRHWGDTRLGFYAHRFKFEDRPASHENLGIRLNGPLPGTDAGFHYRLEYARQDGIGDAGPQETQDYWRLELEQRLDGWRWFLGHERLGGDGEQAFQTPFATLHAHNGWADQFLTTPDVGLQDTWLGIGGQAGDWRLLARWHDFRADATSIDLGSELNLLAARPLTGPWQTEIKLAWHNGGDNRPDVSKLWWTLSAGF
ncbi:alginate export family protein [Natronospira sp.]|uniref:alginate export family protein n=1 Tax=Natronospira sp. TaxID=2024970 RepID=UPI00387359AD